MTSYRRGGKTNISFPPLYLLQSEKRPVPKGLERSSSGIGNLSESSDLDPSRTRSESMSLNQVHCIFITATDQNIHQTYIIIGIRNIRIFFLLNKKIKVVNKILDNFVTPLVLQKTI